MVYTGDNINNIWNNDDIKIKLNENNPKRKNTKTYDNYEKYKLVNTIGQFKSHGGNKQDFKNIINTGH